MTDCSVHDCTMVWWNLYDKRMQWLGERHSHTSEDAKQQYEEANDIEVYYVEESK